MTNKLSIKSETLAGQAVTLEKEINELHRKLANENEKRKDNPERAELEAMSSQLLDTRQDLQSKLEDFQKYDMTRYQELKKKETVLKNEINDHTDNIFTIKKWILNSNPAYKDDDINQAFEIPDDLDNV